MNKDAILATIIGFAIGLVVTSALLFGPTILKALPQITPPKLTLAFPDKITDPLADSDTNVQSATNETLVIDSPLVESIHSDKEILVSGTGTANTLIIIESDINEAIVTTGADGKYAGRVELQEGSNLISVTLYNESLGTKKDVLVFYTPEEI